MNERPLRICLRLLGGDSWLGGVYYTQNLIRCLAELPSDERGRLHITLEHNRGSEKHVEPVRSLIDRAESYGRFARDSRAGFRWVIGRVGSRLPIALRPRYDFVYPASAQAPGLSPGAGWIPDFQHRHLPELFPEAEIYARERTNLYCALNLDRVVLSSEMAANDFRNFYPLSAHKARVLRFTSVIEEDWIRRTPEEVIQAKALPERFFLVSNQFWIHKNHRLVVEAARVCRERGAPVQIAFTGSFHDSRSKDFVGDLRRRIDELGLAGSLHILGQIPRSDQMQLFRSCLAVIQPSKFEGWSTVVEDARALGKTAFMSDFPVHLEQDPPFGRYFAQDDPHQLAELLIQRWNDPRPGYDALAESQALIENERRRKQVAAEFLAIARERRA